jgi:hypothetical protein
MQTACFILAFLFAASNLLAQNDDDDSKLTPYDLISSYYKEDFEPFKKGNGFVGLAFSLQDRSLENTQRLLDRVIDGNSLKYDILFKGGYFIGDYVMGGLNFNIVNDKFTGLTEREGEEIQINSIERLFAISPTIKSYFPLTNNERLSFFMEIGLSFGGGKGIDRETKNIDEITKIESSRFTFGAGITPGVTFFAIENFAFEVGINVVGYSFDRRKIVTNGVDESIDTRNNVNFSINLLSLQLGIAYFIK